MNCRDFLNKSQRFNQDFFYCWLWSWRVLERMKTKLFVQFRKKYGFFIILERRRKGRRQVLTGWVQVFFKVEWYLFHHGRECTICTFLCFFSTNILTWGMKCGPIHIEAPSYTDLNSACGVQKIFLFHLINFVRNLSEMGVYHPLHPF